MDNANYWRAVLEGSCIGALAVIGFLLGYHGHWGAVALLAAGMAAKALALYWSRPR